MLCIYRLALTIAESNPLFARKGCIFYSQYNTVWTNKRVCAQRVTERPRVKVCVCVSKIYYVYYYYDYFFFRNIFVWANEKWMSNLNVCFGYPNKSIFRTYFKQPLTSVHVLWIKISHLSIFFFYADLLKERILFKIARM